MSFSTAFLALMPSTIKISTRTGHSNYGAPTFAATTSSYRARIVQKRGYIRTPNDEAIEISHVIWARSTGSATITTDDRITLPDGTSPPIAAVERYTDEDGIHHTKIMLGY